MDFTKYKRVHCLGIGGIGLSAVAEILRDRGHIVSGTDIHPSKVTRHLEYLGIKVYTKHEPENVEGVDAIVYSAAVSDENPEVIRAKYAPRMPRHGIMYRKGQGIQRWKISSSGFPSVSTQ